MTQPRFEIGGRVRGRFVVRSSEGSGVLGERFLALDEERGAEVQLEVIHDRLLPSDEARRAFIARMQSALSLSHPCLLRVHGVFEDGGRAVLAVEHAPATTLGKYLAEEPVGQRAFEWVRPRLGQIAGALAHAHDLGVVLGDLRPSSVLLTGEGVKVTSVGVATALPGGPHFVVLGDDPELSHLAPELRRGMPCDVRADVYAFAALAITLFGGAPLSQTEARARIPAALLSTLERNLDPEPSRRLPTVEALLAAIDRALGTLRRPGPVTLPASVSARMASSSPTPASADQQTGQSRDADEEELKRLADEISDLLDTTRQVAAHGDADPSAEQGRATQPPAAQSVPASLPRESSGRSSRPTAGGSTRPRDLIEEDDDLEFDLGPPGPPHELTVDLFTEHMAAAGAATLPSGGTQNSLEGDAALPGAHAHRSLGDPPLAAGTGDSFSGAAEVRASTAEIEFSQPVDPFAAAIEEASRQLEAEQAAALAARPSQAAQPLGAEQAPPLSAAGTPEPKDGPAEPRQVIAVSATDVVEVEDLVEPPKSAPPPPPTPRRPSAPFEPPAGVPKPPSVEVLPPVVGPFEHPGQRVPSRSRFLLPLVLAGILALAAAIALGRCSDPLGQRALPSTGTLCASASDHPSPAAAESGRR